MSGNHTPWRRFVAIVGSVAVASALAGCSSSGDTPTESESTGASSPADAIAAAAAEIAPLEQLITEYPVPPTISKPADLKGKTVLVIPFANQIPVFRGLNTGVEEALGELGATAQICDAKFNPAGAVDCVNQGIDQKVDAIVVELIDYLFAQPAFDAAAEAGIPILLGGVAAPDNAPSYDNLAFFDNTARFYAMQEVMAKSVLSEVGEDSDILVLQNQDSATTTKAAETAVATVKETCSNCRVEMVQTTTATQDKIPSVISAALVNNPDIKAIIVSPGDSFVAPVIQGLTAANRSDVKISSQGVNPATLTRIEEGQQLSSVSQPIVYDGWLYVNALMQLLSGEKVQPDDDLVVRLFVADNVADLDKDPELTYAMDWFGNDSFKDQFLTAWGAR